MNWTPSSKENKSFVCARLKAINTWYIHDRNHYVVWESWHKGSCHNFVTRHMGFFPPPPSPPPLCNALFFYFLMKCNNLHYPCYVLHNYGLIPNRYHPLKNENHSLSDVDRDTKHVFACSAKLKKALTQYKSPGRENHYRYRFEVFIKMNSHLKKKTIHCVKHLWRNALKWSCGKKNLLWAEQKKRKIHLKITPKHIGWGRTIENASGKISEKQCK